MNFTEAFDLFLKLNDQSNFLWQIFIVVYLAVIGWAFAAPKKLTSGQKCFVTVAFLAFVLINLRAMNDAYRSLEIAWGELNAIADSTTFKTIEFRAWLGNQPLAQHGRRIIMWFMHLTIDFGVFYLLLSSRLWRGGKKE